MKTTALMASRFWIETALETVRRDFSSVGPEQDGPFRTARALGLALAALNDANALAAHRKPLLDLPPTTGLAGSDAVIAGAAACLQVLLARYKSNTHFKYHLG